MARGLLIGHAERAHIAALRARAERTPIAMAELMRVMKTSAGIDQHRARMNLLSIEIPVGYVATFSIETGHPCGAARHLSVSIDSDDMLPHPAAAWMIAEEFGFKGDLSACAVWREKFAHRGAAINIVQPLEN